MKSSRIAAFLIVSARPNDAILYSDKVTQITRSPAQGGLDGLQPSKHLSFSPVAGDKVARYRRKKRSSGAASRPQTPIAYVV